MVRRLVVNPNETIRLHTQSQPPKLLLHSDCSAATLQLQAGGKRILVVRPRIGKSPAERAREVIEASEKSGLG